MSPEPGEGYGGDGRGCLCGDHSTVILTPRNLLGGAPKGFQTFAVGVE